jgi:outer membrane protein OmpA-like peptidoglycan-associated protein
MEYTLRPRLPVRLFVLSLTVLAAAFALAGPAAAGPVSFREPLTTGLSGTPLEVFTGDFDSDGHQDVLTVRADGQGWAMFAAMGSGDGTFGGPVLLFSRVGDYRTAAVGHFDGDDVPDVVVSWQSVDSTSRLRVALLGVVNGELAVKSTRERVFTAPVDHLAVGNFLGDATDDIAVSDGATGEVHIYDGSTMVSVPVDGSNGAPGPLVGFDSRFGEALDGDLDLLATALVNGFRRDKLYRNTGPTFDPVAVGDSAPLVTSVGDFDADGHQDAAYTFTSALSGSTMLGVRGGPDTNFLVDPDPAALATGDFNGDGADDIAMLYGAGEDKFLSGFASSVTTSARPSVGATTAATADFDEDGRADLVTGHADATLKVHLSNTDDYAGPVLDGPSAYTNDSAPAVSFAPSGPGSALRCRVDGGAFVPCASPFEPATGLPDGPHTIAVQEKRAGLNFWSQSSTVAFTVDTLAPMLPTVDLPQSPNPGYVNSARFELSGEPGASFECRFGSSEFEPCTSTFEPDLDDGEYVLHVRQLDLADNRSAATTRAFILDTVAPAAPELTLAPEAVSNDRRFEFEGEGNATFECKVDDGDFEACASPFDSALADGEHAVSVRQLDLAGNTSVAVERMFTLETVAPAAPDFTLVPADFSNDARFEFEGEDAATFECKVDSGDFEACATPFLPDLDDGEHTVSVRQLDLAGNASPAVERTFTFDMTAPAPPVLLAGPLPSTTERDARFEFAGEPGAAFECALDGGAFAPCTSPAVFAGLVLGEHVLAVRQWDLAGNVGPVHQSRFTVVERPRDPGPQPQPKPKPKQPDEPRPRKAKLVAPQETVLAGGKVKAGCRLDRGALRRCRVTAYVRSGGKLVRVSKGSAGKRGVATVKLTRKGRRLVNRLGGVSVRLRLRATASDGTVLKASRRVRLLPLRALVVPADGLFASGQAHLLARGRAYVRRIARQLDGAKRVRCAGHTDSVGSAAENRRLGLARAKAVCRLLRAAGAKAKLVAASRGETQPRATNVNARGRALNRRVELTVNYR